MDKKWKPVQSSADADRVWIVRTCLNILVAIASSTSYKVYLTLAAIGLVTFFGSPWLLCSA